MSTPDNRTPLPIQCFEVVGHKDRTVELVFCLDGREKTGLLLTAEDARTLADMIHLVASPYPKEKGQS